MAARITALLLLASTAQADISGTYTAPSVQLTLTEQTTKRGQTVEGSLTIADQTFPLTGTVAGDVATGSIRNGDSSFQFTARATGSDLELTSEGISVRLARAQSNKPSNPLHAIPTPAENAEPQAAAPNPEPAPEPDSGLAAKLPSIFQHPLGFSIRHPASWQLRDLSGTTALVPSDAPQLTGGPGEIYALAAMQAPTPLNLVERMEAEMAKALPGMRATAAPETTGSSVTIRYQNAADAAYGATLRATTRNGLLIIMMSLGQNDALTRNDATATEVFRSIASTPRAIPQDLVGSWTHSSSYSSSGFSMASSRTYTLGADGKYSYKSQMAGGTADVSTDTGPSTDRGIWSARDNSLTLVDAEGNATTLKYRLVDGNLVTTTAGGKRTIWSR